MEPRWPMTKIKLIWDFRGPNAFKTAEHHHKHLIDYLKTEQIDYDLSDFEMVTDGHAIAYVVIAEIHVRKVRDSLRPHRGILYTA